MNHELFIKVTLLSSQCKRCEKCSHRLLQFSFLHLTTYWLCFPYLKKFICLCAFLSSSLWFFPPVFPSLSLSLHWKEEGLEKLAFMISYGTRLLMGTSCFWWILHIDPMALTNQMGWENSKDHRFSWKKHYPGYQLTALEYLWFILYLANKKDSYFTLEFSQNLVKW